MSAEARTVPARLVDRVPTLVGSEIVAHLVPPRQFATATLDSYRPDRDYPSQGAAVAAIRNFEGGWASAGGGLFSRKKPAPATAAGIEVGTAGEFMSLHIRDTALQRGEG